MKIIQASFYMFLCEITILTAYEIKCPDQSQWEKRAQKTSCRDGKTYHCLWDINLNTTVERCFKPNDLPSGFKGVVSGNLHVDKCSPYQFAPEPSWSNNTFECVYRKSVCAGEGLIMYDSGSNFQDTTCRCDYSKGYKYVMEPEDACFCRPWKEDCSCYLHTCLEGNILSQDYTCVLRNSKIINEFRCSATDRSRNKTGETTLPVNTTDIPQMSRPLFYMLIPVTCMSVFICTMSMIYGCSCFITKEKVNKKRKKILNDAVRSLSYFSKMDTQLKNERLLILLGGTGSGKTTIGKCFRKMYKEKGYKLMHITESNLKNNWYERKISRRKYFIFVDCLFVHPLKNRKYDRKMDDRLFESLIKLWKTYSKNVKIIITVERYPSCYKDIKDFDPQNYEFNLDDAYNDTKDKEIILKCQKELIYLDQKSQNEELSIKDLLQILQMDLPVIGFPLMASSLLEHLMTNPSPEIKDLISIGKGFVSQPSKILINNIVQFGKDGCEHDFCANVYCMLVCILVNESNIILENVHSKTMEVLEKLYNERKPFDFEKLMSIVYDLSPFYLSIEENKSPDSKIRFSKQEIKHAVMISFATENSLTARENCDICDIITFLRPRHYTPLHGEIVFPHWFKLIQDELFAGRILEQIMNDENMKNATRVVTALEEFTAKYDDIELLTGVERKLKRYTPISAKPLLLFFSHLAKFADKMKTVSHNLYILNLSWMYICGKMNKAEWDRKLLPDIQTYPEFFYTIVDNFKNTLLHYFVIWNTKDEDTIISDSLSSNSLAQNTDTFMLRNCEGHSPLHFAAYLGRYDIFTKLKQIIEKTSVFNEHYVVELQTFKSLVASGKFHKSVKVKKDSYPELDVRFDKDLLPDQSFEFGKEESFETLERFLNTKL